MGPAHRVVIAGAGPVGLALALELSGRGVPSLLVDPGEERRGAPRAKLTNVRSMEHMRRWGLADRLREAAPLPRGYSNDILFVTRLTGHLLTRFPDVFATTPVRRDEFPEPAQQVPQYVVEEVLRAAVSDSRLVARVQGLVTGFVEREGGVTVQVEGEIAGSVEAEYLIGCDGGRSAVRRALGAEMVGDHALTQNLGIVFRAPELARLHPHGPALHYWLVNAEAPGFMGPIDLDGHWWLIRTGIPTEQDPLRLDAAQLVREAVGAPIEPQILVLDPWQAHRLTAVPVASRRVILAGDAAHLHPPFGAHGMNMGIGDAVDLGWKLAATLSGWAGDGLLASYVPERQPLHQRVVDEAALNNTLLANSFVSTNLEGDPAVRARAGEEIQRGKKREFSSLGLVLGYSFDYSPLVIPDGSEPLEPSVIDYTPSARPGSLLPHRWLVDGSSLYDRLGPWFTLLRPRGYTLDVSRAFAAAADELGIPLTVLEDERDDHVLVRPDQIVCWRESAERDAPRGVLEVATGRAELSPARRPASPRASLGRGPQPPVVSTGADSSSGRQG
jgi:2-polyprenyl-6-methoxyphenol hydroxylase-like FAD-dependent oxidoreductase